VFTAAIDAAVHDGALDVQRAGIIRTARKLFDGTVFPRPP
jgi:2-methylaconitate cis-trans-isomerase PrpF